MNAFNILLVILLGGAAITGYFKGIISLAAQVAGLVAGIAACRLIAPALAPHIGPEASDTVVAYVIVFAAAYLGCFLLGRMLQSVLHALHLTPLNRLAGSAFCLLEAAVALSLVMNMWHALMPSDAPADAATGGLRGLVYNVAPALLGYLN